MPEEEGANELNGKRSTRLSNDSQSLLDEKVHMFDSAASVKPILQATQSLEVPKGQALDPTFMDSHELFGKITAKVL